MSDSVPGADDVAATGLLGAPHAGAMVTGPIEGTGTDEKACASAAAGQGVGGTGTAADSAAPRTPGAVGTTPAGHPQA